MVSLNISDIEMINKFKCQGVILDRLCSRLKIILIDTLSLFNCMNLNSDLYSQLICKFKAFLVQPFTNEYIVQSNKDQLFR